MSAQAERMGPWAISPCCLRLRQATRQAAAFGQEPSVKGSPFVLKARGFILKLRIGDPKAVQAVGAHSRIASLARRVQFEQPDGYESVQTLRRIWMPIAT